MKVLFLSSGNSFNNISPIIYSQGESLKECGIELEYFTINEKGFIGYIKHIFYLKKFLRKKNYKYDIIHAHYGLCGIISLLAKRKEKLVVSFMGDDLIGSINSKEKYSLLSKLISKINYLLAKYFYNYSIVKSEVLANKLKNCKNFDIIPNGVNLNKFYPINKNEARKELNLPENEIIIIFVSNPQRKEKNYNLAKKSIELVKEKILLIPVFNKSQDILNLYYNSCDVVLLTSYHEGSPNVIKEAMACNTPIVATNVGDIKWIFGDTEGCYITSFDPNDVAQKIDKAIEFAKLKCKTNGRERIIKLGLDEQTIAKKIIHVYNKVLNKCVGSVE